ncbi:MAG: SpoIID/LytB domain-containing protein [Pelosinus sp.]|nr:SpoIID/LytB domain-containing protein [Pelosinus sp.]
MKTKHKKFTLAAVIILVLTTGFYIALKPPASKPMPTAPPEQETPKEPLQSLAGEGRFPVEKYQQEPEISVWLADKGYAANMPLEKYLEGVVAQEMEPHWPSQALAAQAIVSRTLTLHAIQAGIIKKLHNADVSTAKEELQAYAPQKVNAAVRQAIKSTRGQALLYGDSLINAIYSSCDGQISAAKDEGFPKEIMGEAPYLQPVPDTCFQNAPPKEQAWQLKVPAAEVAGVIGYSGNPADITILEKGPSGRILYIGAGNKKMFGADFRKAMGYDRFRSTLITEMTYTGDSFLFKGLGWGSGIGMCQWGAYTYAQQGWGAEAIIKHYYNGVEIKTLWP